MTQSGTPAPGWYADPDDDRQVRYWDGSGWTEHRRAVPGHPATAVADDVTAGEPPPDDPPPVDKGAQAERRAKGESTGADGADADPLSTLLWDRLPHVLRRLAPQTAANLEAEGWLPRAYATELVVVVFAFGIFTGRDQQIVFTLLPGLIGLTGIFMAAFFSRYLGLAYASGYVVGDLTTRGHWAHYRVLYDGGTEGAAPTEQLPFALGWSISRLIVYLLLFVIVLLLPALADALALRLGWIDNRWLRRWVTGSQFRTHLVALLAVLVLFYQAAPLIIRGVFLVIGVGPTGLLRLSEAQPTLVGAMVGLAARYLLAPSPIVVTAPEAAKAEPSRQRDVILRTLAATAAVTLLFAGLYSSWSDIILGAALATVLAGTSNGLIPPLTALPDRLRNQRGWLIVAALVLPLVVGKLIIPGTLDGNNMHLIVVAGLGSAAAVSLAYAVLGGFTNVEEPET